MGKVPAKVLQYCLARKKVEVPNAITKAQRLLHPTPPFLLHANLKQQYKFDFKILGSEFQL